MSARDGLDTWFETYVHSSENLRGHHVGRFGNQVHLFLVSLLPTTIYDGART